MSTLIAISLFWVWLRSFWLWATMPVLRSRQADGRVGLVDVLAAGALASVGVHPDLVPVELDLDVVLGLGQDLDQGERRLAAVLRVERRDPDQPMDAALGAQPAVRPAALDLDGRALDAGLVAFLAVDDLGLEPMPLRPAQVHPQEHLGPVGGLGAAGARADGQDGVAIVVLAGEQEGGPLADDVLLEGGGVAGQLGFEFGVGAFVEQLERRLQVLGAGGEGSPGGDFLAQAVRLAEDLLRAALVVPEPGFLGQCLEFGDPCVLGLEVKDAPRSTGSVRSGRGWWTRPPSSGPADPGAGWVAAR